jgi:YbbR domain-containing protein
MKLLFENFGLKLFAFVLAIATWFFVTAARREQVIERSYDVPITIVGLPSNLIITTPVQEAVSIRVRGRLSAVSSQNLEATIDLANVRAGDVTAVIRPQHLNLPEQTEVLSIVPAKLSFRLEERRQRWVPIRPFLVGDPPAPMEVLDVEIEPSNALVSGPASMIRDFTETSTERIVLGGRSDPFTVTVGVVSDRSLIRVVEPMNARVTINVAGPPVEEIPADSTSTAPSERIAPPATADTKTD